MFDLAPWRNRKENQVATLRKEMDSLFDRFFRGELFPSTEFMREGNWLMRVDVSEGKKDITVKAEIPGVEAKDIDISLDGRKLCIKGEKNKEKEEKNASFHRMELSYGFYNRTIELPAEVDSDSVDATYKKGVLTVKLKKTRESDNKKIDVKSG